MAMAAQWRDAEFLSLSWSIARNHVSLRNNAARSRRESLCLAPRLGLDSDSAVRPCAGVGMMEMDGNL
jgi:hypothetical protein